jgi:riboflavin kinase/FMN adenylyltransferase
MEALGLDAALVIPFNHGFSRIPAEQFIRDLARGFGRLRFLAIGHGFTFGHRRGGDVTLLETLGRELDFVTRPLDPVCLDGLPIRSTRIRELIVAGELAEVARMLNRPYSILGKVLRGDGLGGQLGYPTANLDVTNLVLPPLGVYTAQALIGIQSHRAILNLGRRPTLNQPAPQVLCEVHLLDFQGDLYDQSIEVHFGTRLREERKFPSLDALREQIQRDVAAAREILVH